MANSETKGERINETRGETNGETTSEMIDETKGETKDENLILKIDKGISGDDT